MNGRIADEKTDIGGEKGAVDDALNKVCAKHVRKPHASSQRWARAGGWGGGGGGMPTENFRASKRSLSARRSTASCSSPKLFTQLMALQLAVLTCGPPLRPAPPEQ